MGFVSDMLMKGEGGVGGVSKEQREQNKAEALKRLKRLATFLSIVFITPLLLDVVAGEGDESEVQSI